MTALQTELFPDPAARTDTRPTHVVRLGDPRTLCGIRVNTADALPFVGEPFVERHIAGHGLTVCPACDELRQDGDR